MSRWVIKVDLEEQPSRLTFLLSRKTMPKRSTVIDGSLSENVEIDESSWKNLLTVDLFAISAFGPILQPK